MTEETNKLRALILTVLMVTSVFAGTLALAGTAAAANDDTSGSLSVDSGSVAEGQSATVTFTINAEGLADDTSSDDEVVIEVPDGISTDNIVSSSHTADIESGGNDITVTGDFGPNSDTITVQAEHTFPSDISSDVTASIPATLVDSGGNNQDVTFGPITIANDVSDDDAKDISTTSRVFAGQVLYGEPGDTDAELELQRATATDDSGSPIAYEFETAVSQTADGDFKYDTSGLERGNYKIVDVSGETSYEEKFAVSVQSYDATADPASVSNAAGETDLIVTSNRNGYTHYVSSPDYTPSELQTLLGDVGTPISTDGDSSDDEYLRVLQDSGSTEDVLAANFTDEQAGNYTINFLVPDTGATASTMVNVSDAEAGDAAFVTKALSQERGDLVEFNVSISGAADTATVNVGSSGVNYQESVTVTDDDDDGYVTFYWNTYRAGTGGTNEDAPFFLPYGSDDELTITETVDAEDTFSAGGLGAGEYPVNVEINNAERDVATVVLGSPDEVEKNINVWTAREGYNDFTKAITQDRTIAVNDTAVLEVQTAGVYGQLTPSAVEQVATTTSAVNEQPGTIFTINQTEASTEVNQDPEIITVNGSDAPSVVLAPSMDTMYVVVDTEAYAFAPGQSYEAQLKFNGDSPYYKNTVRATQTFSIVERTANIDAPQDTSQDPLIVTQSANATVTGTSSLATGTNLTVTARSQGGQNPFLRTGTAQVADGTWTTSLDVSDIPTGTNFTMTVKDGSTTLDTVDAQIGGAANIQLASLDAPETATPGETITVTATVENTGDSSGETEVAFVFANETVATQNVTVDAGSTAEVTFEPTVPSETGDYTHGVQVGDNDVVTAGITVQEETTTTEPTTTEPTTTEPTTTEPTTTEPTTTEPTTAAPTTSEEPDDETTTEESGGQPGFGVAVALVALLAAALLATRRDN